MSPAVRLTTWFKVNVIYVGRVLSKVKTAPKPYTLNPKPETLNHKPYTHVSKNGNGFADEALHAPLGLSLHMILVEDGSTPHYAQPHAPSGGGRARAHGSSLLSLSSPRDLSAHSTTNALDVLRR